MGTLHVDTGKTIGVDQGGNSTTWVTVITNQQGQLVTAFPGLPSTVVK